MALLTVMLPRIILIGMHAFLVVSYYEVVHKCRSVTIQNIMISNSAWHKSPSLNPESRTITPGNKKTNLRFV